MVTRIHFTRWEGERLVSQGCILPPPGRPWPRTLDTGSAARQLAATLGWSAAVSLAVFALVILAWS